MEDIRTLHRTDSTTGTGWWFEFVGNEQLLRLPVEGEKRSWVAMGGPRDCKPGLLDMAYLEGWEAARNKRLLWYREGRGVLTFTPTRARSSKAAAPS